MILRLFLLLNSLLWSCLTLKIDAQKDPIQSSPQTTIHKHNYYNIEETNHVSQSRSIQFLNKCKDLCLEMHIIFPFQFKYHRLIYRQPDAMTKYITGQCLYTFRDQKQKNNQNQTTLQKQNKIHQIQKQPTKLKKWYPWKQLNKFLALSTVQDFQYLQQKKTFDSYITDCEDEETKLSETNRIDLGFSLVHSDFQYYESQGFSNLSPFDDLDRLFQGLQVPDI